MLAITDQQLLSTLIVVPGQALLGRMIKKNPNLANGMIFWVNAVVGIVAALIGPYVIPGEAHAMVLLGVGSTASAVLLNPIVLGFIQATLTTGWHSAGKNTWQMLKAVLNATKPPGVV